MNLEDRHYEWPGCPYLLPWYGVRWTCCWRQPVYACHPVVEERAVHTIKKGLRLLGRRREDYSRVVASILQWASGYERPGEVPRTGTQDGSGGSTWNHDHRVRPQKIWFRSGIVFRRGAASSFTQDQGDVE